MCTDGSSRRFRSLAKVWPSRGSLSGQEKRGIQEPHAGNLWALQKGMKTKSSEFMQLKHIVTISELSQSIQFKDSNR